MNVQARHLQDRPHGGHKPSAALLRVLSRIPEEARVRFTDEQLAALDGALDFNNAKKHPVNFRVTLFGLAYLVVLGGREQRGTERRAKERERHPLLSPGNAALMTGVSLLGMTVGYALRSMMEG